MILQVWNHLCTRTARSTILPDGCRDVLITRRPGAPPQVTLSALQTAPEAPLLTQGSCLTGYRLAPGQRVARLDLLAGPAVQDDPRALIDELTVSCAAVDEALACLGRAPSVHVATRDLGVSAATLLRVLRRAGLPPPRFWLQLAQARRAARGLIRPGVCLADLAAAEGYADQAHMTRQFRRFFGLPPGQMRLRPALIDQMRYPALATGEQISTSVPSGSDT